MFLKYPNQNNQEYKNNLGISFEKLGNMYVILENYEGALRCYENYNILEKELFNDFSNIPEYKNRLAISAYSFFTTKSILASGYFLRNSWISGVVRRISPREERRMMRIFIGMKEWHTDDTD